MCTSAGAVRCCYKWIALERTLGVKHLFSQTVCNRKLAEALRRNGSQCVSGPFFSLSLSHFAPPIVSPVVCSAPCGSNTFGCGFVRTHFGSAIRKSNVHNHRYGSSSVFILAFVGTLCVIFVVAGDYGQSHEQVMICTRASRKRERKKLSETNGSRMVRAFRIENWNKIHFARCEFCHVHQMIAIHSQLSALSMRHTLMSASSLRFHNRIIPFHHVHVKSQLATAATPWTSVRIVFCSQRFLLQQVAGCSAPLCYFMHYIIYASLVLEHSSHYSRPPRAHTHTQTQPHTDDEER